MKSGPCRFGPFTLLPAEHRLLRDRQPVKLARKDFELLVALIERPGHLVRKEELLQRLWPDAFVEEGNLAKHVSILRKALGDMGESGRIIETVPRVGVRFVATITPIEPETTAPLPGTSVRHRPKSIVVASLSIAFVLAAVAALIVRSREGAAAADARRALAVLPFTALADDRLAASPLGIGLADGIITRLSGQRLMAVRPTSLVRTYIGRDRPNVRALAVALDADVVLEGHIQQDGDVVRITAQLFDVARGAPIWASTFDQQKTELFRLEDAIADRVAGALRLQIAAAEQDRLKRRYTENGAAYEAYLTGRAAALRYTPDGSREAVGAFERALALDPSYALARAGLAMASADMYLRFAPEPQLPQWGERAEREAAEALALDPDLAEAHVARAAVLRKRDFDWDQAIVESRRAATLNPNLDQPHLIAAAAFYHLGLMDQSRGELDRGRTIGGVDAVEPLRIDALIALFSGEFAHARLRLEEVSRRSSRAIGDVYLALATFYGGDRERARVMLETLAHDTSASNAARAKAALAGVLAATGDAAGAREAIARVLEGAYRDHHVAYSLGVAFAQLGDEHRALQWLRSSADSGFPCTVWYARDPLLEPLRRSRALDTLFADLDARLSAAMTRYRE